MKAVDALRRFMDKKNFALCNSSVYRKIPESKYAYVYFGAFVRYEYVKDKLPNPKIFIEGKYYMLIM